MQDNLPIRRIRTPLNKPRPDWEFKIAVAVIHCTAWVFFFLYLYLSIPVDTVSASDQPSPVVVTSDGTVWAKRPVVITHPITITIPDNTSITGDDIQQAVDATAKHGGGQVVLGGKLPAGATSAIIYSCVSYVDKNGGETPCQPQR